jgi:hypothetical protein
MTIRVEVPVLLYADVQIDDDLGADGSAVAAAKKLVYGWLGAPGEETGIALPSPGPTITRVRLYTDHPTRMVAPR